MSNKLQKAAGIYEVKNNRFLFAQLGSRVEKKSKNHRRMKAIRILVHLIVPHRQKLYTNRHICFIVVGDRE